MPARIAKLRGRGIRSDSPADVARIIVPEGLGSNPGQRLLAASSTAGLFSGRKESRPTSTQTPKLKFFAYPYRIGSE